MEDKPLKAQTLRELQVRYRSLYDSEPTRVDVVVNCYLYRNIRRIEQELEDPLNEAIVGNEDVDIADLIRTLDNKAWVEEGQEYVDPSKEIQKCPFCQQDTVDKALLEKFTSYFDETYKKKVKLIQSLKTRYSELSEELLDEIRSIQEVFDRNGATSLLLKDLEKLVEDNINLLEDKIRYTNERKHLRSLAEFTGRLSDLNERIRANDANFDNLKEWKSGFVKDVWIYLALECEAEIKKFDKFQNDCEYGRKRLAELQEGTSEIINYHRQEIAIQQSKTKNTQKAVNGINSVLRNSGFDGFSIEEADEKKNNIPQYFLKRSGEKTEHVFKSLSEGERNFIAFLYFYQCCLGTDDPDHSGKEKILVIDDPVSSLDSQVLFIVSTLIHQLIKQKGKSGSAKKEFGRNDIKQVFILTHNLYFYKEVSFDKRPICKAIQRFLVTKEQGSTAIEKVTKKVFDDYSLLWSSLVEVKAQLELNDRTRNISIANTMRRILESFVNFNGIGSAAWDAIEGMDSSSADYILCSAFLSSINDDSHKLSPLDDFYYQRIIDVEPQRLYDAFELIFSKIGRDHYDYMMEANDQQQSA